MYSRNVILKNSNTRIFRSLVIVAILVVLSIAAQFVVGSAHEFFDVSSKTSEKDEEEIPSTVDELLGELNLGDMQKLIGMLDGNQLAVFGFADIKDRVSAIANGKFDGEFGGVVSYVLALFGADVFEFLPMMFALLAIVLAYGILNSVKGRYASESIERVVYFATGTLAVTLIVGHFAAVLTGAVRLVASLKTQINTVAPVLITLMTASGASASAGVYTPTIAFLGSGMTSVITYIAFPALLMGLVFDIIGSVCNGIKLTNTAEFFRSTSKWLLGTAFFLFIAVIGVSGITASVRDGVSVRAARFAVSKYVPIIGGYLSQGFDFVMAGNVLIKNALGQSAVILIVLVVSPVLSKLVIFTLTVKLTSAIAEPLGGDRFCGILNSVSKSSSMIATVVVGMTFLYIMFLSMIMLTGNVGL